MLLIGTYLGPIQQPPAANYIGTLTSAPRVPLLYCPSVSASWSNEEIGSESGAPFTSRDCSNRSPDEQPESQAAQNHCGGHIGQRQSGWPVKRHSSWPVGRG